MTNQIKYFGRMLCAFMLCAGLVMTSCEGEEPIGGENTEQGGNENGGDENNGSGDTTGGENGGGEGEPQGPVTINLSKVTATTATFTGHLNIPASDLPFSKVSVFYSSSETFNVNNARYKSTTKFDDEQNFTISITELDCNTQYNYCVVTEIKSEKSYGDIKNFTTTEVCVSLTPKESNIIAGSPIAEFDIVVTGLTEDDNNYVGTLVSGKNL